MRPTTIDCPLCGAAHEFYLRAADDRHLRQCPDCEMWLVLAETASDVEVEALGNPATCPVEGCESVFEGDDLPAHVVDAHDATLDPA
ncbi:MAG: hypothetical protein ABEJ06_05560 [Haloarculaceae archaeon]